MSLLSDDLRSMLDCGQAVVVIGAGVSLAATSGASNAGWHGLLEDGIARCVEMADVPAGWDRVQHAQLELGDIESWLAVAEQVTLRLGGPAGGEFGRWLRETVGALQVADGAGRALLEALVGMGVPICTTNYDGLIEDVARIKAVTWRDGPRAQRILRADDAGIVHLHGFWDEPESVILGVRSYDEVLRDGSAQAMLRALATMRSLVLVGFGAGLDDPNFAALRAWMAQNWSGSEYRHFQLVRESERDAVLREARDGERIQPVVYGTEHEDLIGFLQGLVNRPGSSRTQAAASSEPPSTAGALPAPRAFFGREDLVEQVVDAMLDVDPAPVPVLGPPGIGKSALTQACAHDPRVVARFGTRRFWVRCDSAETAASVAAEIAFALGISGTDAPEATALTALGAEPALLLLDNAETPWEGDLPGTEELLSRLAAVSGLALVCSFRGAQRPIGPQWHDSITVPPLPSAPAEQVFLAAAGQQFAGDPALAGLLTDLDGMPIAIELLGRLAQPESDLEGLRRRWEKHRTDLLAAGSDPDRYRSVAISFDLSIANPRLPERARRLLSVLAHLPDGVAVAADLDAVFEDGERAAAELRAAGLSFDETGRVRVLKPIRDHVAAHYEARAADLERATAHYLSLTLQLGPMVGKAGGARAVSQLVEESGNVTFAIDHALAGEAVTDGIDAALALTDIGRYSGLPVDHLTRIAIRRAGEVGDTEREAEALFDLGLLAGSNYDAAREAFEQAIPLYHQINNVLGEANCIRNLGDIALQRSEYDTAREAYEQALPLYRQIDNILGETNCIKSLGDIAFQRSEYRTAREAFEQALPLYRQIDNVLGEANCIRSLGNVALHHSDLNTARAAYDRALALYTAIAEPYSIGMAHIRLILVSESDEAAEHRRLATEAWRSIDREDLVEHYFSDDER